jgi:small subunit ribosomal protein S8
MDVISNMLISIKNGGAASKDRVIVPFSILKNAIAKALLDEGYIAGYEKIKGVKAGFGLAVTLKYTKEGKHKITNLKRVSKPSRRLYAGVKDIYPVLQGTGKLFLSTPKGILTGDKAQQQLVGGEILFEMW